MYDNTLIEKLKACIFKICICLKNKAGDASGKNTHFKLEHLF